MEGVWIQCQAAKKGTVHHTIIVEVTQKQHWAATGGTKRGLQQQQQQ